MARPTEFAIQDVIQRLIDDPGSISADPDVPEVDRVELDKPGEVTRGQSIASLIAGIFAAGAAGKNKQDAVSAVQRILAPLDRQRRERRNVTNQEELINLQRGDRAEREATRQAERSEDRVRSAAMRGGDIQRAERQRREDIERERQQQEFETTFSTRNQAARLGVDPATIDRITEMPFNERIPALQRAIGDRERALAELDARRGASNRADEDERRFGVKLKQGFPNLMSNAKQRMAPHLQAVLEAQNEDAYNIALANLKAESAAIESELAAQLMATDKGSRDELNEMLRTFYDPIKLDFINKAKEKGLEFFQPQGPQQPSEPDDIVSMGEAVSGLPGAVSNALNRTFKDTRSGMQRQGRPAGGFS